jgi:hypothetical protein
MFSGEEVPVHSGRPIGNQGLGLDPHTREPVRTTSHRIKILRRRFYGDRSPITRTIIDLRFTCTDPSSFI